MASGSKLLQLLRCETHINLAWVAIISTQLGLWLSYVQPGCAR